MEQMMKDLYKATVEGSVTSLRDLLRKDALILERCTVVTSYAETPLHIAAMLGHLEFCSDLVSRNPRLIEEVDCRRSTALHIASAKGHVEIVTILLAVRPEMCLWYDGDGLNPIHIAAMKGRVDVLEELVRANPDGVGARVRACQGGTTLHLCVQYYQIEALKFLVEAQNDEELLNAKDDNGNSILHLSVGDKQVEIVEYLVSRASIDVDALNSNGLTASNILALQTRRDSKYMEIAHVLQLVYRHQSPPQYAINRASSSITGGNLTESQSKSEKNQDAWLEKQQNSILVVASLIATMAFQAGVNPPDDVLRNSQGLAKSFMGSNTIGFLSSISVILLLISGLPLRRKVFMWTWMVTMWISIVATTSTYIISMDVRPDYWNEINPYVLAIYVWLNLMGLLFILQTIRFLSHRTHDWRFKSRLFMWIFMFLGCIVATAKQFPFVPFSIYFIYPGLVRGWIVMTIFLVSLYAIQVPFFIIKKLKTWFKELKSHLCSGDQSSNNVV